ncbi:hypothetical protein Y032_0043g757 [Ancylostoma ceylanicum]|uniref:ShKT domain-containing protein n=1 Tax=Ancylostoma ceylanicum TaxID=53326 RepID=A0A016UDW7_9BILA|nr:hypothetical protein Y032_0043g757 [Ancylostoma ceylanicum]
MGRRCEVGSTVIKLLRGVPAGMSFLLIMKSVALSVSACEALVLFIISLTGAWMKLPWTTCRGVEDCIDHRLTSRCMFASPNDTICSEFIRAMVLTRSDHIKNSPLATYVQQIVQGECKDRFPTKLCERHIGDCEDKYLKDVMKMHCNKTCGYCQ